MPINLKSTILSSLLFSFVCVTGQIEFEEKFSNIPIAQFNHGVDGINLGTSILGDIDGDGDLDIFTIGMRFGVYMNSAIYFNNGTGAFVEDTSQSFLSGFFSDATFLDAENDGDLDLMISLGQSSSSIKNALYLNDGAGQFSYSSVFEAQASHFAASKAQIKSADLNGDTYDDILILKDGSFGDSTEVYLSDGLGNYNIITSGIQNLDVYSSVSFTDFDSNGNVDFFAVDVNGSVVYYENGGSGLFSIVPLPLFDTLQTIMIEFEDLNNDGHSDFVANVFYNGQKSNLYGYSDGSGGHTITNIADTSSTYLESYFFVDFNNDDAPDLVGINNQGNGTYLMNDVTGNFLLFNHIGQFPPEIIDNNNNYKTVTVGDINTDGYSDFINYQTISSGTPILNLFVNDQLGNFYEVSENNIEPVSFADCDFGDIDNDGDLDLIVSGNNNLDYTNIYINDGTGSFTKNDLSNNLVNVNIGSCEFVHIDANSTLDIIITGKNTNNSTLTASYLQNQTGHFINSYNALSGVSNGQTMSFDFDGDHDEDVIIAGKNGTYLFKIYENIGNGQLQFSQSFPGIQYPLIDTADVDHDGDLDLLISGEGTGSSNVSELYLYNGSGFVLANTNYSPTVSNKYYATFGDINNDGNPDIVGTVSDYNSPQFDVYINDGNGNFNLSNNILIDSLISGKPHLADFNQDGFSDLVIYGGHSGGRAMDVYLNDQGNQFIHQNLGFPALIGATVATADFNGDGKIDLFYTGNHRNQMKASIFLNVSDVSGIKYPTQTINQLSVYPNPTSTQLFIATEEQISTVNIHNISGELVQQKSGNVKELDFNALPEGVYTCTVLFLDGSRVSKKVIIQR